MALIEVPGVAVHYHLADKAPFLNLSDLSDPDLSRVMRELTEQRARGEQKRVFGRPYIELRRRTEALLYERFVEAGGEPVRRAPHYFCLGTCAWFRELAPDMREVSVPLDEFPDNVTSFTYPDSFTSMGLGPEYGLPYTARPYHGRVFRLSELPAICERFGLPDGSVDSDYEGYQHRDFEKYIEIQLWSDEPIRALLTSDP